MAMQVDGGCCKDEEDAKAACKQLADKLSGALCSLCCCVRPFLDESLLPHASVLWLAGKASQQQPTTRALQRGPVQMASADNKKLLYDESMTASARQVGSLFAADAQWHACAHTSLHLHAPEHSY